jgi:hypothetical protein
MNFLKTIAAALILTALLTQSAFAGFCGYFQISASSSNVPPTLNNNTGTPGGPVSLNWLPPYTPGATSWSFGTTLPADTHAYVTDICLQDKYVNYFATGQVSPTPLGTRSSYLVVDGLWTGTSHQSCHFSSPLLVPPGFAFTARLFNHAPENQNMIGLILGYAYDSETCRLNFRP